MLQLKEAFGVRTEEDAWGELMHMQQEGVPFASYVVQFQAKLRDAGEPLASPRAYQLFRRSLCEPLQKAVLAIRPTTLPEFVTAVRPIARELELQGQCKDKAAGVTKQWQGRVASVEQQIAQLQVAMQSAASATPIGGVSAIGNRPAPPQPHQPSSAQEPSNDYTAGATCDYCGKRNHTMLQCRCRMRETGMRCHACNQVGHKQGRKVCPRYQPLQKSQATPAVQPPPRSVSSVTESVPAGTLAGMQGNESHQ